MSAFREIQRYIDSTRIITIPYEKCINMTQYKVSSIPRIYRVNGITTGEGNSTDDPIQLAQWQLMTGNMYNYQDYIYNYAAWNTILQTRNTSSTDLSFIYDKASSNLYINSGNGVPSKITIEFIPKYEDVNEITSDYWVDMLLRLSIARTKIVLGRIRSRFSQSNALWMQDGEAILAEGNAELADLREKLVANTQLVYPID